MADAVFEIVKVWGAPGAFLVLLGIAYFRKDKQVADLQNQRVEDVAENVRLMAASTRAMEETADAMKENTRVIRELAQELARK